MGRSAIGVLRHPHAGQRLAHPGVECLATQPEVRRPEGDVLADGRHEQLVVGVLEDDPDPLPHPPQIGPGERQAVDHDRAPAAGQDAVQVQDEGRLPGAVRAEERHPLAAAEFEIDALQRRLAVRVAVGQVADLEDRVVHDCHARIVAAAATAGATARAAQWARAGGGWTAAGKTPV